AQRAAGSFVKMDWSRSDASRAIEFIDFVKLDRFTRNKSSPRLSIHQPCAYHWRDAMRLLSVAERELRAAARHQGLYHLRWLTAAGAFALLLWLGWAFGVYQSKGTGPAVFQTFTTVIFVYCLFVGAAGTADCISRERR